MKVVITGSSGFLGKRLCAMLGETGRHSFLEYDIVHGYDICNPDQLEQTFVSFRPDAVIHLAACADLNLYREQPELGSRINIDGTSALLDVCERHHVRMLFASTCCCYGNTPIHPTDETVAIEPTEPYALSKAESERQILAKGLPHCCMRLATFYGPAMRPALAPAIFLANSHRNLSIEIHGSGEQTRTMTYVDDIVRGILTILESAAIHMIVNISTEERVSVHTMIEVANTLTGNRPTVVYGKDRPGQIFKEHILSKRLEEMGWSPQVSFAEGMRRSYEWFVANGETW